MDNYYGVDQFSLQSLYIDAIIDKYEEEVSLGGATGFIVEYKGIYFLVTNRHVVSGKNTDNYKIMHPSLACPNKLVVFCHSSLSKTGYGAWTMREVSLYDKNDSPVWFEHPNWETRDMEIWWEKNIDIAVIPLPELNEVNIYTVDLFSEDTADLLPPGIPVSIVGYPFSESNNFLPIWKTGHIASDIRFHHEQLYFYIDSTTKPGMSGAPVAYREYIMQDGNIFTKTNFIGIYSGRISEASDIGVVWRKKLIQETIEHAYKNLNILL